MAEISARRSFPIPVTHALCEFELQFIQFYSLFNISEIIIGVTKISICASFFKLVSYFL